MTNQDELTAAVEREILNGVALAALELGRDPAQWVGETQALWAAHGRPRVVEVA